MADNLEVGELFDDVAVSWKQDPDVGPATQCPGQSCRNGSQSAYADEVVHFSGDEQDFQNNLAGGPK
jgi:hypothetical protein